MFFYYCVTGLKDEIRKVCQEEFLVCGEGDEQGSAWMEKVCNNTNSIHYLNHFAQSFNTHI